MRQDPNIKCLDEVGAYIQSQESDSIARKGTGAQDRKVNLIKPQDGEVPKDPPKKPCSVRIWGQLPILGLINL